LTFCTGGLRCEKAAIHIQNVGYNSVYQLEDGILNYFEEMGGEHYHDDCLVFDYRTALNPQLEATDTTQCDVCCALVTHVSKFLLGTSPKNPVRIARRR
jgi:UPF0176 protein